MPKRVKYHINMKDGSSREIWGTAITDQYAYDKRVISQGEITNSKGEKKEIASTTYCLSHIPTGTLITSADKVNTLKLLCAEPEFFDDFDVVSIGKAVARFWNKHNWQEPKITR